MKDTDDSSPMPLTVARRKLSFDPTINAGHILTFLGMMFALFAGWTSLDKRVLTLERDATFQAKIDSTQDAVIKEKFEDIRNLVREVQQSLNEMRRSQPAK